MEKRNVSTRSMEEEKVLEKYVTASLKAFPILLKFCKELNEAVGDMRTEEEIEKDKKEHARIKEFLEKGREAEKQKEYTRGYAHGWKDAEDTAYVFFEVKGDTPIEAISFSVKKSMTRQEFVDKLADWGKFV